MAGGLPTLTYISREEYRLEQKIQDYLDERHRILSISGPTKTGKTVLVKSVLAREDAIWLSGGTISSLDELWSLIADYLGLITQVETTQTSSETDSRTTKGELGVGVLKGAKEGQSATSYTTSDRTARSRSISSVARDALRSGLHSLVIDDFHYIEPDVQLQIVRGLKDLVFDGLPVIVIAVPHRAYDVVRVEKEMTGRVEQLEVGFWSKNELLAIAHKGFEALNVQDPNGEVAERLAGESFSSPHLMQTFCLHVCKENGVRERSQEGAIITAPIWDDFFAARASNTSRTAFDMLVQGPRQRTDRKVRTLKSGTATDIYGVVLAGIAHTGPLTSVTYEALRASLREILSSEVPQRQEITRVLEEMSKIARVHIEGEPVVDYDESLSRLYISDPFFAFFLRWRVDADVDPKSEEVKAIIAGQANNSAVGQRVLYWRTHGMN
ncbi:hypothetical protein GCM10009677_29000 [Sphaerisporangium rubeum]